MQLCTTYRDFINNSDGIDVQQGDRGNLQLKSSSLKAIEALYSENSNDGIFIFSLSKNGPKL